MQDGATRRAVGSVERCDKKAVYLANRGNPASAPPPTRRLVDVLRQVVHSGRCLHENVLHCRSLTHFCIFGWGAAHLVDDNLLGTGCTLRILLKNRFVAAWRRFFSGGAPSSIACSPTARHSKQDSSPRNFTNTSSRCRGVPSYVRTALARHASVVPTGHTLLHIDSCFTATPRSSNSSSLSRRLWLKW